jgi:hypothetical protein
LSSSSSFAKAARVVVGGSETNTWRAVLVLVVICRMPNQKKGAVQKVVVAVECMQYNIVMMKVVIRHAQEKGRRRAATCRRPLAPRGETAVNQSAVVLLQRRWREMAK